VTASASATSTARLESDRTLVLVLSYLAFVVLGLLDGMLGVLFALMRVEFNMGLDALSAILIPTTVGFLIASFYVGRILNRRSMAMLIVLAGSLRALSFVGVALAPQWWIIPVIAIFMGMSGGAIDAGMNTWFAIRYSPRLMNWLHASFGVGATVGPIALAGLLGLGFDWRSGFVAMASVQVLIVLAAWLTRSRWRIPPLPDLTEAPPLPEEGTESQPAKLSPAEMPMSRTLRLPAVWLGIAVFFFYTGVELTTGNWSFTILTEARGIDIARAATWVSLFWGSFALGRIFFGFVEVRSLAMLLRGVMVAALLGALLLALGSAEWMALVAIVVIGFSVAPVFPLLVSETPLRLGRAHAQNAIGLQVGAASLGIAVLPSLAGAIAEATSVSIIPWFIVVVAVILILLHELLLRTARHVP
jgi:fucose permease